MRSAAATGEAGETPGEGRADTERERGMCVYTCACVRTSWGGVVD